MFNDASAAGDTSLLTDLGPEGLDAALRVIVGSAASGHRYASRVFVAQGSDGSIVTTSSASGLSGGMGPAAYTVGKRGQGHIARFGPPRSSAVRCIARTIACTP